MRGHVFNASAIVVAVALLAAGCDESPSSPELADDALTSNARGGPGTAIDGPFHFDSPVYDIEAAPNGNILVAESVLLGVAVPPPGATSTTTLWEIRTRGQSGKRDIADITTPQGVSISGLASTGSRSAYATRGGVDTGFGAALLHVTPGGTRMVADVQEFETRNDPDAFAIADWKDPACAAAAGFTPGPQSNPYHLTPTTGNTVLVADAAGNTLLRVDRDGEVEVVALFTPPVASGEASDDPDDWLEFPFAAAEDGFCYVQPVPTSVALGPDGAIYVGELTGAGPGALGVSRVWRIEPGTENAVCPSDECETVLSGLTAIIDIAFGPDGDLYVVEYDENGFLAAFPGPPGPDGGTVNRCDVEAGSCEIAEVDGETLADLTFPTAITFDKGGDAWLLENNLASPTVRKLE